MPTPITLGIHATRNYDVDKENQVFVDVNTILYPREYAEFAIGIDGGKSCEAFIAHNPDDALRWICNKVDKALVMRFIRQTYDDIERFQYSRTQEEGDDSAGRRGPHKDEEDTTSGKRKRKRATNNTRALNKAITEKMNRQLAQTIASTQDWEDAKRPAAVSVEEQRYRNFARRLPGVGVNAVTQMISSAVAVGTMEVFRDWHAIITVWKRQRQYGKKLFEQVADPAEARPTYRRVEGDDTPMQDPGDVIPPTQRVGESQMVRISQEIDEAGLSIRDADMFRYRYFDAQKTRVDGIADDMRHRWKMDRFYEEYERLEKIIRQQNPGTGARGRGYNTVAKEYLFEIVYGPDLKRKPTKEQDTALWVTFGQMLDWGKRWNILKRRIGSVGIFGLLPRSMVHNDFVQKRLTQTRVGQWVEMLAECNKNVTLMAKEMEPLFLACMEESEPPPEFTFLEDLDALQEQNPLQLLLGVGYVEDESDSGNISLSDATIADGGDDG